MSAARSPEGPNTPDLKLLGPIIVCNVAGATRIAALNCFRRANIVIFTSQHCQPSVLKELVISFLVGRQLYIDIPLSPPPSPHLQRVRGRDRAARHPAGPAGPAADRQDAALLAGGDGTDHPDPRPGRGTDGRAGRPAGVRPGGRRHHPQVRRPAAHAGKPHRQGERQVRHLG